MYIKDLAQDMGFDFGLEREGGSYEILNKGGVGSFNLHFILIIAFGGDVEMFACIGKNVTNWHFDGQDVRVPNSSILLTEIKIFSEFHYPTSRHEAVECAPGCTMSSYKL